MGIRTLEWVIVPAEGQWVCIEAEDTGVEVLGGNRLVRW